MERGMVVSKLDKLIKELELKKKSIEFYQHILKSTKSYKNKDFEEVRVRVVSELEGFVNSMINQIEDVGEKVQEPVTQPCERQQQQPAPQPFKEVELSPHEKASWALSNRSLGGKDAAFELDGKTINGTIVGLDAPYVIVLDLEGIRHKTKLNELKIK